VFSRARPGTEAAADQVQWLTTGLSGKIWQKIMLVDGTVLPEQGLE
jgi:hypothetical protein